MKFRKKPVVIDAEQFFDNQTDLSLPEGVCVCMTVSHGLEARPHIHTREGAILVSNGDMIIKGIKGEFYACKPDIFEATYEVIP